MNKTINPKWWNDKHAGAWDRVKDALARDWEQTKADFSGTKGQELDQDVGDTVRQAAGRQPIPPEGYPNPGKFDDFEPGLRFGYSAANEYKSDQKWDDRLEMKLKREWEDLKSGHEWDKFKAAIKRGWERARRAS